MSTSTTRQLCGILVRAVAATVLIPCALAGEGVVRIANRPAVAPFGSLQQAIDGAIDGETLIVGDGLYGSFQIDNRNLAILAAPNASVTVNGTVRIENVGPQRSVVLAGIEFVGADAYPKSLPGIELANNVGGVWLLNCTATGGAGVISLNSNFYGAGGDAVVLRDCARVALARCMLIAGDGASDPNQNAYETFGGQGGVAVRSESSSLALYATTALGGDGGHGGSRGGDGGDGVDLVDSGYYLGGGVARGGKGGNTWDFIVFDGANGGHGVDVEVNSQARFVESTLSGGAAGLCSACSVAGAPGAPSSGAGLVQFYAGVARSFSATRILADSELWGVQAVGVPGDWVFVTEDDRPTFSASQPVLGVTLVPPPANVRPFYVGRIPASGVLNASIRLPVLANGVSARTRFAQGLVIDASGQRWPSTPLIRTQLDRDGAPDCDGNSLNDLIETIYGLVPDTDFDFAPDACAPDCNNNAISDVLETRSGAAADVDLDLIPDACESNTTWYVDAAAPQGGDGGSSTPFRALRAGVGAALPGDTVLLLDGLYNRSDSREIDLAGKSITVRSMNGPTAVTFDLKDVGRAFRLRNGEQAVVEGFTFRNGLGGALPLEPSIPAAGGAILADLASVEIRDCVFEDNRAEGGGAVRMRDGRIENCRFEHNQGTSASSLGGAVFIDGVATVVGSDFTGNNSDRGGALVLGQTTVTFDGCRIVANTASTSGGGVELLSSGRATASIYTFANVLIAGNEAPNGGGVFGNFSPTPQFEIALHSSTMVGNRATVGRGGAIFVIGRPNVRLVNCIQRGNVSALARPNFIQSFGGVGSIVVDRSDIEFETLAFNTFGGTVLNYAASNFDLDPLFLLPAGLDGDPQTFEDNVYELGPTSPCIDAGAGDLLIADLADRDGDGDTLEPLPLDAAGATRRVDDPLVADSGTGPLPALDIGAFERQP